MISDQWEWSDVTNEKGRDGEREGERERGGERGGGTGRERGRDFLLNHLFLFDLFFNIYCHAVSAPTFPIWDNKFLIFII